MRSVYLLIALGGALGAVGRYAFGGWVHTRLGAAFPWGTLAVNVLGSTLLGLVLGILNQVPVSVEARAFLTIGVLGAFTTFSTFSYETVALLRDGEWRLAVPYVGASLGAAFIGLALGLVVSEAVLEATR